jgi:hypothetical protein
MTSKPAQKSEDASDLRGRLWQPPEQRGAVSEAARKWQKENTELALEWAAWVEKHGTPLPPLF